MKERAIEWMEEHEAEMKTSATFEDFCGKLGTMGEHYSKYVWLPNMWNFWKLRGWIPYKNVAYPAALNYSDLFSAAMLVPNRNDHKPMQYEPGFKYLGARDPIHISGNYGGKRDWSPDWLAKGEHIRRHMGGTFYHLAVKPNFEVPRIFDCRISLEAIPQSNDPKTVLVTAQASEIIASNWLAYLEPKDSLEDLLRPEDREFLARERQAEIDAWGTA